MSMNSGNVTIGAGTYRMNIDDPIHVHALQYAVESGCRIIDTAPNYQKGKSEELVGYVVNRNADKQIRVVTKAGYVTDEETGTFGDVCYRIQDSFYHCIHPQFLEYKLRESLERMQATSVYAFLLHNPEYILPEVGHERFYSMIREAFLFLETMVTAGVIGCYGISSNTLAEYDHPAHIAIDQLIDIAGSIKEKNGFKIIQFPHNIYEKKALDPVYNHNGAQLDLFAYAKKHHLLTMINRPFTGNVNKRPVPIMVHADINPGVLAHDAFSALCKDLDSYAAAHQVAAIPGNGETLNFLRENWRNFKGEKLLRLYIDTSLLPFLNECGLPPSADLMRITQTFYDACMLQVKNRISTYNKGLKRQICSQYKDLDAAAPFTSVLCTLYARQGADIILTGMRQEAYVEDVRSLLTGMRPEQL